MENIYKHKIMHFLCGLQLNKLLNNCYCICFLRWMNGIFKKGYKRPLENADVYAILPEEESKQLTDRLERSVT